MKTKVLAYPKDTNPYQNLLYSHMEEFAEIRYLGERTKSKTINNCLIPVELIYYRIKGYKVFHLHWLFPFHLSRTNKILLFCSNVILKCLVNLTKILNYKFIWTIHNWLPHERTFLNDESISKYLAKNADHLIVLNSQTMDYLIEKIKISKKSISLIPMGNFIKSAGHVLNNKSRKYLSLLFFGQIRSYKGISELVDVVKSLSENNLQLKIVGHCRDTEYDKILKSKVKSDKRIEYRNEYVAENELNKLLASADIVVLPFIKVTNTSSAILSFSTGKPIIAPRMGMIMDFPESTGIYYDPNDNDGLKKSIEFCLKHPEQLKSMSRKCIVYAKSLDWKEISKNTLNVYVNLL